MAVQAASRSSSGIDSSLDPDHRIGGRGADHLGVEFGRERLGGLDQEAAVAFDEQVGRRVDDGADAVAECHPGDSGGDAALAEGVDREQVAGGVQAVKVGGDLAQVVEVGATGRRRGRRGSATGWSRSA